MIHQSRPNLIATARLLPACLALLLDLTPLLARATRALTTQDLIRAIEQWPDSPNQPGFNHNSPGGSSQ